MKKETEASILLINPCYNRKETLGPFDQYISSQLPLSIGFLAGYLLSKGISAEIFDEQLAQITEGDLASFVEERGIQIIGISVLTLTSGRAYELGAGIKAKWPHVTVIMGGVHVTLLPEEPLTMGVADIVVRNEGEITLHELVARLLNVASYHDIAGISFRRNGKVVNNPARPLITDLDVLPPFPYHLFEKDITRYQFGNLLISRGCPYECIFCSQRAVSGRRYRFKSPEMAIREIETLIVTYGQRFLFINDDNFLCRKEHVQRLCDLIIRRKFPDYVQIGFNGRGDSLDPALLQRMREAHFAFILIGFETASERLMEMIKKGETVQQISEGVRIAKKAGFTVGGQFILGFPSETRKESWQTIFHALNLPIDFVRFNLLVPYPGTEVYEMIKKENGLSSDDWSLFATHGGITGKKAPYVPKGRTHWEMVFFQWLGHLLFYLRPRQLLNIRNLRYATGGQLTIPEPTSVRGCIAFAGFILRLAVYGLRGILRTR